MVRYLHTPPDISISTGCAPGRIMFAIVNQNLTGFHPLQTFWIIWCCEFGGWFFIMQKICKFLQCLFLPCSVWIMGILSIVGNIFVIFCRMMIREPNRVHSFYIRNLAVADLLMGVFLLSIAAHDVAYRGQFLRYQFQWRHSAMCQISGGCTFCNF